MEPKARVVYKVWDLLEKLLNQTKLHNNYDVIHHVIEIFQPFALFLYLSMHGSTATGNISTRYKQFNIL